MPFARFWLFFASLFVLLAGIRVGSASLVSPPENVPPLPSPFFDSQSYIQTLEKGREHCTDEGCRWWFDFIKAKHLQIQNPKGACELFIQLSEKSDFPLRLIALSRRADACSFDANLSQVTLNKIKDSLKKEDLNHWKQEALDEAALRAAITVNSKEDIFTFSLDSSKRQKFKKNRIVILQSALDATKNETDPKFLEARNTVSEELYRIAPHLKPKVNKLPEDPNDIATAGADAMSLHDYEGAARTYEKVVAAPGVSVALRRTAFENLKNSYKALQKKSDAFKISKRSYFWELSLFRGQHPPADESKHVLSSGLVYAKFLWTDHKSRPALAFLAKLEQILSKAKGSTNLSELYFVRARIDEELRLTDKAMLWMKKAEDSAEPSLKGQYGWTSAWISFKEGKFVEAQKTLEALQEEETDTGRRSQEMFWLAKSYQKLEKPDEGRPWLEKIIQEDPLGYYALLSYRELNRPIPRTSDSDFENLTRVPRRGSAPPKTLTPMFQWLVSTGETRWAQELLDEEFPLPDATVEIGENMFLAYSQAAYFVPIFSRISKISAVEKERLISQHSEYLFPRLYRNAVEEASVRSGIWPSYLFSIMRQESSFDPLSISGANAYGLLQLLPSVAASLAKKSGVPYKSPEDLLDPTVNIMLGSQHLRNYWEEFDGQFILTTAAYNASPASVKTWVRTRFRGDPLVFIEDIPYDETRVYVKLVLRNFIHYLRIGSSGPTITFPEWCLEGIHPSKN